MLGRLNYSLQGFSVESGAVPIPGGGAASQDALHSATVELSEDCLRKLVLLLTVMGMVILRPTFIVLGIKTELLT